MSSKLAPIIMPGEKAMVGNKWYTVGAVCWLGERYYMLLDEHGDVALMPADAVKPGKQHAKEVQP